MDSSILSLEKQASPLFLRIFSCILHNPIPWRTHHHEEIPGKIPHMWYPFSANECNSLWFGER